MSSFRADRSRIKITQDKRTPQGGLALPVTLTRVGVFTYQRADGSTVRELRLPEEVFDPESLRSFAGAPITIGHPGRVTPDNYATLAVGHVGDDPKREGNFVKSTARIQASNAVDGVERGDYVEVSCGYDADIELKSGTHPTYSAYDAIQRNIRGNHLALCPPGTGRAGPDVRLHVDTTAATDVDYAVCHSDYEEPIERAKSALSSNSAARYATGSVGPTTAPTQHADALDPILRARATMAANNAARYARGRK